MFIKKCDRCGIEMSPANYDNEIMFTKVRKTQFGIDSRIHLCEKCLNDFQEFMKNHRV